VTFAAVRTANFRNLADSEVVTQAKDVFLVGENGQGKTNFLEALYFCSYASSFRNLRDSELVKNGEKDCSVQAKLTDDLADKLLVKFENGKKAINFDGKAIADRKELLEIIPCIVFCHEDMDFVSGPPEERRRFFDQTQSLYDAVYLEDLRKYRRVLKNRNAVLKAGYYGADNAVLDTLDPQLAEYGLALMKKRDEAVKHFSEIFGPLYESVSGIDNIAVKYAPSWKTGSVGETTAFLAEKREQEKTLGMSLSGPHRDRYVFVRGSGGIFGQGLNRAAPPSGAALAGGPGPPFFPDDREKSGAPAGRCAFGTGPGKTAEIS